MYKKICNLWNKFWTLKGTTVVLAVLYVISLSIMIMVPISNNSLEKLMTNYPETSYQELEDEASRIIISGNFVDTEYHFHIQCYDNITNYLCFDLSNDSARITAKVENYKKNNQVSTIERNYESPRELFAFNLLGFLIFPLLSALLALIILMLVFSLFKFLVWIIKK